MRSRLFISGLFSLALCWASILFAQEALQRSAEENGQFSDLDKNGDGRLSPKELANQALFERMDVNSNGWVTLKPALSIIDFSIGLESDGPSTGQGGTTVDMKQRLGSWAVVASTDIMAADATAARIMNHDATKVKQLSMGFEMGLGEIREESIEVLGEKLDNVRVAWKPARIKGHRANR